MPLGGAIISNVQKAQQLAKLGIFVFPVLVTPNPENPYKTNKRPAIPEAHPKGDPLSGKCKGECGRRGHGFYDATDDPGYVVDLFEKYPRAEVGLHMGASGLVAGDFDVKRSPDGTIEVDGFDSFEKKWLELPDTHSFESVSKAGGKQYIYAAPEGVNLGPAGNYRDMLGVDRRGGGSYSVWQGDVPTSRVAFSPAPEWLLDPATVRDTERFEGSVKDWMESLEKGEPSLIVRAAMDRTRELFESAGNDFDHAAMVERQFEAIRLGSEGHSGVDQLLDLIEELFLSREGSHSRGEEEWNFEWAESLSSGIEKYGAALELRSQLPAYSISLVPQGVPDRLVTGEPGDKTIFRELLASLLENGADDITATSVLWNSPRTSALARDWGLEFVHKRVQEARLRPEPVRENPTLKSTLDEDNAGVVAEINRPEEGKHRFLTPGELAKVNDNRTFIDSYCEASEIAKGFAAPKYDIPAAWTALSMVFGTKAYIPYAGAIGVNLWFIQPGYTGTGKTRSKKFLGALLDVLLKEDSGSYFNVGAASSPSAIHEELLNRDNKASMLLHDEAATFFSELHNTEWMKSLEHYFSAFYDGDVEPSNKVRLPKEIRGKSARTAFNLYMLATPEKLYQLINTEMFDTGFLSRVNWSVAPAPVESDERYQIEFNDASSKSLTHPVVFEIAFDLASVASGRSSETPVMVKGTPKAAARISKAFKAFDAAARKLERYEVLRGPIVRLSETLLKCSALLALYRGEDEFDEIDALTAIYYASMWYEDLIIVVSSTSETEFSRDVNELEAYVRSEGGSVSQAKINHRFRNMIRRSPRELQDRIDFLILSGRVNREAADNRVVYRLNGGI